MSHSISLFLLRPETLHANRHGDFWSSTGRDNLELEMATLIFAWVSEDMILEFGLGLHQCFLAQFIGMFRGSDWIGLYCMEETGI